MSPAAPATPMPLLDDLSDCPATVAGLWIYPVKSCAGLCLPQAELTPTGLAWDRAWMVVDAAGEFVTQRELPRMALIQARFDTPDGLPPAPAQAVHARLVLSAPGMAPLALQLAASAARRAVRVWDDAVEAFDMGTTAAQWLSDFLAPGAPADLQRLRLVRFDLGQPRLSSSRWTGPESAGVQFADGFALLVLSTASVAGLNARLLAQGEAPVEALRFRPNLLLSGLDAHGEDRLDQLHSLPGVPGPALRLELVKPCARCPIPNIDLHTALSQPAVGDALQSYRCDPRLGGAPTFGMNAVLRSGAGGVLALGQRLLGDWRFD